MLLFFNKVSALILDYSKPNNSNSKKQTAELSTQFLFLVKCPIFREIGVLFHRLPIFVRGSCLSCLICYNLNP